MYPSGQPQPLASTLNAQQGQVVANAAIVPAGIPNGSVSVFVTHMTDLVIDINGYYAPQSGTTLAQGDANAPSLSFVGDPGTGIFSSGAGTLNVATGGTTRLTVQPDGDVQVSGKYLRVSGAGNEQAYVGGDGFGNDVQLGSFNPNVTNVGLWNGATNTRMNLFVGVLTITGGSDLAEPFEVSGTEVTKPEPGMVVAIDPANPGRLRVTNRAYDRSVAGIVSGAGDVKPGLVMSQSGSVADGSHPVALSGRVYCWADASHHPIHPGDLLTSSDTPGHAMKATANAQGAIIGKAMTSLEEGTGLVLVLVTLQ